MEACGPDGKILDTVAEDKPIKQVPAIVLGPGN